jgi:hypothetical protein
MGLREDGEAGKISPGDLQLGQATGSICSLNEVWFPALNKCATDTPMSESILPLMRCYFFDGAMHITKFGFSWESAAIEMMAWLFSLPTTKNLHPVRCQNCKQNSDRHWEPTV